MKDCFFRDGGKLKKFGNEKVFGKRFRSFTKEKNISFIQSFILMLLLSDLSKNFFKKIV